MNEDRVNDREPGVLSGRKLRQSVTARAVGIVGVAALVVVGSIVGAAALSGAKLVAPPCRNHIA